MSYLLLLTLFGPKFTNIIPQCFILSNTNRQIVIHMDSMEVIQKVFEIKGLCAFVMKYPDMYNDQITIVRTCAGKLTLRNRNSNKQTVGYIMKTDGSKWKVLLLHNSEMIELNKLMFDRISNSYIMVSDDLGGGDLIGNDYNIIKYESIRFSFSKNHQSPCKCAFNQLGFKINSITNDITIINQYCT